MTATLNKYGNLPIGFLNGKPVFPTPNLQLFFDTLVERTGGVVSDDILTTTEYDVAAGAPMASETTLIDGGPVGVAASVQTDAGPVETFTTEIDGEPI